MIILQQEAKLAVEPAVGAAMAGLMLPLRKRLKGKRVGLIVCGANIDEEGYSKLLERGRTNILRLTKNS
jgi:threonine dehydratase